MKKLLLFFALIVGFISTQAQDNPFEKYGYTPKVATLSQGQFNESFDNDTVVQMGSVLFNTKTKQIIAFVEYDTLYSEATLEPDIVSRWMSPDPLAAKAPGWSPYRFAFCNPIMFVDPDGKFEIPKALLAAYPELKPALSNVLTRLQDPSNAHILKEIVELGEFQTSADVFALFSDENKSITLGARSMLSYNSIENKIAGDHGEHIPEQKPNERTGIIHSKINLDNNLYRLLGDNSLSSKGKDFANLLFESTLLHEIAHHGDYQDGSVASKELLQFSISDGQITSNLHNKEIGVVFETNAYGENIDSNNNPEVKENIKNNTP